MIYNTSNELRVDLNKMIKEKHNHLKSIAVRLQADDRDTLKDSSELVNEAYFYLLDYGRYPKDIRNLYLYFAKSMTNLSRHPRLKYAKISKESNYVKAVVPYSKVSYLFTEDSIEDMEHEQDYYKMVSISLAITTMREILEISENSLKATLEYIMGDYTLEEVAKKHNLNEKKISEIVRRVKAHLKNESRLIFNKLK